MLQVRKMTIGSGRPKICVPLVGSTKKEIIEQCMRANESAAEIIEWRVDYFDDVADLEKVYDVVAVLREMTDKLLLFTFRTKEEGRTIHFFNCLSKLIHEYCVFRFG